MFENVTFRNLLFIYPKFVNLTSKAGNYRNISLKVELLNDKMEIISAIYDKFGNTNCKFTSKYYSIITYHSKFIICC